MHAKPRTIFDIFDGKRRYLIPIFQRQYVWSREKQWEPFWKDLRDKAEEILTGVDDAPPHFLGAIVISLVHTHGDQVQAFDVIDGQQRLTTFQIFLGAFHAAAVELGQEIIAGELQHYTRNTGMMERPEEEKFKVWPSQPDIAHFVEVMSAGSRWALEEKHPPVYWRRKLQPRPTMIEAFLYFQDAIVKFAQEEPDAARARVRALYDALNKRLQLVSIELEGRDDPQIIFETLNARGEPLLASDLLRNFIFLRASRKSESAKALYDTYWSTFDKEPDDPANPAGGLFWKKEERQGRLTRARLDLFMQHFLSLKTEHEVNIGRLYQEYRSWILTTKPYDSVQSELVDLTMHARAFRSFFAPNLDTRLGLFSARLRTLDTATVYPFLLALVTDPRVPAVEVEGILTDLESYLIRRMVCERTIKNYNRLFLKLFRDITKDDALTSGKVTRAGFQKVLLAQEGDTADWPSDAVFKKALLGTPLYDRLRPALIDMVLRGIERQLSTAKGEKITIHTKLTIEHVLPQSWEEQWPLPAPASTTPVGGELPEDVRERMLHTLGNLTLLTQELNTSVRNAAYSVKQPEITAQSALRLNAYFQKVGTWDEAAILARGEALFEVARKVWPHPGVAAKS